MQPYNIKTAISNSVEVSRSKDLIRTVNNLIDTASKNGEWHVEMSINAEIQNKESISYDHRKYGRQLIERKVSLSIAWTRMTQSFKQAGYNIVYVADVSNGKEDGVSVDFKICIGWENR